jgi:hypothetical protein
MKNSYNKKAPPRSGTPVGGARIKCTMSTQQTGQTFAQLPGLSDCIFVHYQCADFDKDNTVFAIGVRTGHFRKTEIWAVDGQNTEADIIERLYSYLSENLKKTVIHWNMDGYNFGPQHFERRLLQLKNTTLPDRKNNWLNLSDYLWNKYGSYAPHKRLDNLCLANNINLYRGDYLGEATIHARTYRLNTCLSAFEIICQKESAGRLFIPGEDWTPTPTAPAPMGEAQPVDTNVPEPSATGNTVDEVKPTQAALAMFYYYCHQAKCLPYFHKHPEGTVAAYKEAVAPYGLSFKAFQQKYLCFTRSGSGSANGQRQRTAIENRPYLLEAIKLLAVHPAAEAEALRELNVAKAIEDGKPLT